ncbi:MAG TPA: type II toxin-antitoxin system VapC family toxin [Thermoplasmata archaeon]|nr:type II toxin-antitoxin system VapC family toxin [Thermoplasmata archaeon]
MRCLESTFCIDLLRGDPDAARRIRELEAAGERLAVAAPTLTEVLVGAHLQGGRRLADALEFTAQLEVLEVSAEIALEAARLGGECARKGGHVSNLDLLIGATAKHHHAILMTRDADFSRIPGVLVEAY